MPNTGPFTRHRRPLAAVAIATAVTAAVAGCNNPTPVRATQQSVCVTATGHIRVDDYRCAGASMAYEWWFFPAGVLAPAIGQRVTTGSATRPPGATRLGGVPATPTTTTTKAKTPTTKAKAPTTVKKRQPTAKAPKPKPAAPKVRTR